VRLRLNLEGGVLVFRFLKRRAQRTRRSERRSDIELMCSVVLGSVLRTRLPLVLADFQRLVI
jgi:hypothetical protein